MMTVSIDSYLVTTLLPDRPVSAHKGNFGSALVIAGSRHFTGAALLAGEACLRSGAGLVFMGIPACLHAAMAGFIPEAIWKTLPCRDGAFAETAVRELPRIVEGKSSILIGPGLGQSPGTRTFIANLFEQLWLNNRPEIPVVLDADALNLLYSRPNWSALLPHQVVLTPHHKEMSRLTGLSVEEIGVDPVKIASDFAQEWQAVVVLKGATTVIGSPTKEARQHSQPTSSLAHGGTGDILAGMITGLLAQQVDPFDAATIAVYVHNQAARLAEAEVGWPGSVLPRDIIHQLGRAFSTVSNS